MVAAIESRIPRPTRARKTFNRKTANGKTRQAQKPSPEKPAADKPATEKPTADKPTAEKPAPAKRSADEKTSSKSVSNTPALFGPLKFDEAKSALLELVKHTDDGDLHRVGTALESIAPHQTNDETVVAMGPWRIDLKNHSFVFMTSNKGAGTFLQFSGKFFRDEHRSWSAGVTEKTQT